MGVGRSTIGKRSPDEIPLGLVWGGRRPWRLCTYQHTKTKPGLRAITGRVTSGGIPDSLATLGPRPDGLRMLQIGISFTIISRVHLLTACLVYKKRYCCIIDGFCVARPLCIQIVHPFLRVRVRALLHEYFKLPFVLCHGQLLLMETLSYVVFFHHYYRRHREVIVGPI